MSHPSADQIPKPPTIPDPTWWPAALALGITLTGWGLIASYVVFLMGFALVVFSVAGWIGDILDERKKH
jgi:hypothetical protein